MWLYVLLQNGMDLGGKKMQECRKESPVLGHGQTYAESSLQDFYKFILCISSVSKKNLRRTCTGVFRAVPRKKNLSLVKWTLTICYEA